MISDQDKQRIEEAAKKRALLSWAEDNTVNTTEARKYFQSGAESEHPIAYNKALEDVIKILSDVVSFGYLEMPWDFVKEELQKMRK